MQSSTYRTKVKVLNITTIRINLDTKNLTKRFKVRDIIIKAYMIGAYKLRSNL